MLVPARRVCCNNSTMTARHTSAANVNDAKNSIFQLKSHRVNVPFNKDNFVDSYFLLSLSRSRPLRGMLFAFCCLLLWLTAIKKKNYVSIWRVRSELRRGTIFISIRESKTNKQVFLLVYSFHVARSTIY